MIGSNPSDGLHLSLFRVTREIYLACFLLRLRLYEALIWSTLSFAKSFMVPTSLISTDGNKLYYSLFLYTRFKKNEAERKIGIIKTKENCQDVSEVK